MGTRTIWIDGRFVSENEATVSVFDHGLLYGDGVFEGIRVVNGKILKLQSHILRLYESAKSIYLGIPYSASEFSSLIRAAVEKSGWSDAYIRLVITRGKGPLGVSPLQCPVPGVIIIVDTIALFSPSAYEKGISIITASTVQKHPNSLSPRVKSLNYLTNVLAKLESVLAQADEAVMFNHLGFVAECVVDNIFLVKQTKAGPIIRTPSTGAGILEGITMNMVVELACTEGLAVERNDHLTRHDLYVSDEIFLTGTGAEVVPVVKIDGRQVADGKPGPVTRRLVALYREVMRAAPED